jgi:hypothetical protein
METMRNPKLLLGNLKGLDPLEDLEVDDFSGISDGYSYSFALKMEAVRCSEI